MPSRRLLTIGLDGFDVGLAERFLNDGELPNFERLRAESARYQLDHGRDRIAGVPWEQINSGKSSTASGRWSPIGFDRKRYSSRQEPTYTRPFVADVSARTVVFDVPYCDLSQAPGVLGVTNWGTHDPGAPKVSHPDGIHEELDRLLGPYEAGKWHYSLCWNSAQMTREAGDALAQGVEKRSRAARWLLKERLPDWEFAMVVVSESHSAIEAMWHGVDPNHPLHGIESASSAGSGLRKIYRAIDGLIGNLREAFPEVVTLVFAMHGMGSNECDAPSMALLPELLYRAAFGKPHMSALAPLATVADGTPLLAEGASWEDVMLKAVPHLPVPVLFRDRLARKLRKVAGLNGPESGESVGWIPAERYAPFWPSMPAFALPSFGEGRVRMNVAGRERKGVVSQAEYPRACEKVIELLEECRNLQTGGKVVDDVYWPKRNPLEVGPFEADLYVEWQPATLGLVSPRHGTIGPVPFRRTGGHTGGHGLLYVNGKGIAPRDGGVTSSFDVVPTILDLLGEAKIGGMSGRSLARELGAAS